MKILRDLTAVFCLLLPITTQAQGIPPIPAAGSAHGRNDSSRVPAAELRHRTEEWKDAYNSQDLEKLAGFYAEDADYVSPHVPDLMIHGRQRIRDNFSRGIRMGGHIDAIEVLSSDSSCELASLVCRYRATNGGTKVIGRNVLVMKRIQGEWLITTHASIVTN